MLRTTLFMLNKFAPIFQQVSQKNNKAYFLQKIQYIPASLPCKLKDKLTHFVLSPGHMY